MVGIKEEGSYRRVGYSVSLRSNVGQWTFRVDVHPSNDLVASETFISPAFYNTDVEAHRAAVELAELYIDRQLLSHKP
jgi:hypothetical protein